MSLSIKWEHKYVFLKKGVRSSYFEVLDRNARHEWSWPIDELEKLLVIKKPDVTQEDLFDSNLQRSLGDINDSQKLGPWKWSNSFPISKLGQLSIQLSKEGTKELTSKAKKIVRIIIKQVEVSRKNMINYT